MVEWVGEVKLPKSEYSLTLIIMTLLTSQLKSSRGESSLLIGDT